MDPTYWLAHCSLGWAYLQKRQVREAIAAFQKARQLSEFAMALVALGHAYAASGNRSEALKLLAELKEQSKHRFISPLDVATLYAGLGDKEQALTWLEKAYDERSFNLVSIKVEPFLDSLRAEPRFQALVKKMNFPN
jgi:serine/threonine-protein kinase